MCNFVLHRQLSDADHDRVLLFKIYDSKILKKDVRRKLPISTLLPLMASVISPKLIVSVLLQSFLNTYCGCFTFINRSGVIFYNLLFQDDIKSVADGRGNYAANKRFFLLASCSKLAQGWSRLLLECMNRSGLKELSDLMSPCKYYQIIELLD